MAEPRGLIADFRTPERLVAAAKAGREAGLEGIDAFTPFPVHELNEVLAIHDNRIPWLALSGAVFGLVGAYAMQIATNLDYRLDIGGRPLLSLQAFALIGFELMMLFAVLFMVAGFFMLNRLPRYHHPLFWVDRFERASRDGFFLFIPTGDAETRNDARVLLERLQANSIDEGTRVMPRLFRLAMPLLLLAACNNMVRQERYDAYGTGALFADGKAMQTPPEGTVARDAPLEAAAAQRPPMTLALLDRGRERYAIYCTMCHGTDGSGDGTVVARGFPRPADFRAPAQRALPADRLYAAISNGAGVMYGFADRVPAPDRWAIAAYVEALRRSGTP